MLCSVVPFEALDHASHHPQGCRVPKTLNASASLDQKPCNVPAPVAYRIVQRGPPSNRRACRFDVGAAVDERDGRVDVVAGNGVSACEPPVTGALGSAPALMSR